MKLVQTSKTTKKPISDLDPSRNVNSEPLLKKQADKKIIKATE